MLASACAPDAATAFPGVSGFHGCADAWYQSCIDVDEAVLPCQKCLLWFYGKLLERPKQFIVVSTDTAAAKHTEAADVSSSSVAVHAKLLDHTLPLLPLATPVCGPSAVDGQCRKSCGIEAHRPALVTSVNAEVATSWLDSLDDCVDVISPGRDGGTESEGHLRAASVAGFASAIRREGGQRKVPDVPQTFGQTPPRATLRIDTDDEWPTDDEPPWLRPSDVELPAWSEDVDDDFLEGCFADSVADAWASFEEDEDFDPSRCFECGASAYDGVCESCKASFAAERC